MAVSNLVVKQDFVCNGVQTIFAIPFSFIKVGQIKVILINTTTGVETIWTLGSQFVLDPPYNPMLPNLVYLNVVANVAPASGNILRIIRDTALTQDGSYVNNSQLLLEELEKSFDKVVYMIQELDRRVDHVPILNALDQGTLTVELPKAAPNQVLALNAAGTALTWVEFADLAAENGTGLPVGGDIGDAIEKTGPGATDLTWMSFNYDGIAALTGGQFTSNGLKDTLDKVIRITYTPPVVSLSGSSNTLREKGAVVSGITLTTNVVKKSNPIAAVRFYQGATLLDTQTSGGAVPNGGNSTYAYGPSFSDNISFSTQVDDTTGPSGGPTTTNSITNYSFVYPYYVGAGASGLTAAGVAALSGAKRIINSTATYTQTITATAGQTLYIAYPASYGALVSILDVNNFEVFPDWTLTTGNVTGLDGNAVSYRRYALNNPVVAGNYTFTWKR